MTLQWAYAYGPMVVLGGGALSYGRGTPVQYMVVVYRGSSLIINCPPPLRTLLYVHAYGLMVVLGWWA
jgi:hypothetical protein